MEAYHHGFLKPFQFESVYSDRILFIRHAKESKFFRVKLIVFSIIHKIFK